MPTVKEKTHKIASKPGSHSKRKTDSDKIWADIDSVTKYQKETKMNFDEIKEILRQTAKLQKDNEKAIKETQKIVGGHGKSA